MPNLEITQNDDIAFVGPDGGRWRVWSNGGYRYHDDYHSCVGIFPTKDRAEERAFVAAIESADAETLLALALENPDLARGYLDELRRFNR
jgi:hypothetical protein